MFHPEKAIRDLISRFLEKKYSEKDLDDLYAWLSEDPANKKYFDKINESYQTQKILDEFKPEKIDAAWHRLSERLEQTESNQKRFTLVSKPYFNFLRIAASVSLLLVASFFIWKTSTIEVSELPKKVVVYNPESRNTYILLPDSTKVWLNINSTIEYENDFGQKKREVVLKGEAFFDVKKKNNQKFIVKTEQLSVVVKGTRFNVRAYQGEDVRTTLEEGKVELMLQGDQKTYDMDPGDQITVKNDKHVIMLSKVNPSNYTAWKENQLVFDNTPLSDIILRLENRYKVHITIDSALAERERLTMTIGNESIDEILEMLQLSSRLNYRKQNDQITIYE